MYRTAEYRRAKRNSKIKHRKSICKRAYGFYWYEHDNQYNKGKIHCSCALCKPSKHGWCKSWYQLKEEDLIKSLLKDVS